MLRNFAESIDGFAANARTLSNELLGDRWALWNECFDSGKTSLTLGRSPLHRSLMKVGVALHLLFAGAIFKFSKNSVLCVLCAHCSEGQRHDSAVPINQRCRQKLAAKGRLLGSMRRER